ncbi:NAD(P)-dependent alcohol dehydrogenase [Phocoenobacter skyensis]|uniref:NAD(P)-dependent alcohol dehydrogenase n=1 Tax=Phocoenobacter skyensis TaxID=97481 RepID=A0A1H7YS40_9PAST|nr:NAD(P)-dependent alcohol dehydrogenase [Pasteurella skyensis]MDP8079983.1 NAD(P)-dependent alcohol dehydrogenase [Pasteurella skyensis]MDP8085997.1 NAD(P)-dependent alcohol dehydrogenase [Pasteurella skyensis]MDP8185525.1 NAD(P)-dependent alcohol dehydrogenase [Pasteurella skyensis]QLB22419.1 hypothetical protein A6B44_04055 [Pasteurella skyensis]SEM48664.1 NADPH:quinone reductase [Pasteurella skyensis]
MKRVEYLKYGNAEELQVMDIPKPKINGKNKLLVKVLYSSLNAIDWKNRKGKFRIVSGLIKPRTKQGFDVVGIVVDKSENVTEFKVNDKIVGQLANNVGGALSEYVILTTKQVVKAPLQVPDEQLGGLSMAGTTAWQAFFENAKLKKGDKVLINGGSSGVGHIAIQIAKAYGAEVTTVSSEKNIELCKKLGAEKGIDYSKKDFTKLNEQFDIVFDVIFNSSLKKVKGILKPNGIYIGTIPTPRLLFDMIFTKQAKFVAVRPNKKALTDLLRLMEKGLLSVNIDKIYELEDIVEAHKYMEKSKTKGKVIIRISK